MLSHRVLWRCVGAACLVILLGCASSQERKKGPMLTLDQVTDVMDRHTEEIMHIEGVVGIAIGALEDSSLCIQVLVKERSDDLVKKIPEEIEGVPVVIEETGEIKPLGAE